ncbi:MAG: S41 family peptidase [Deltaproteobacteria bacterium]|nr:S41 family peptidase [Deltaproteobacteria bacterium]
MRRRSYPGLGLPALFLLALAATAGGMVAARPLLAGRFDPYHKLAIFTKVLSYIENNYVEDISETELMYGAARGLTEVLDPHSRFMDPEEYDKLKQETEGNAEIIGIGIDLEKRKRGFVVVSPIEGSPAWRAGIESGDLIERIDGVEAGPLDWNDAIARIQGPAGSEVTLSILRRGRSLTVRIKREKFEVRAVEWRMLAEGYGYIKVRIFSSVADAKVLEGLEDFQKQTQKSGGLKGLIFDVRHNPGGLLDQGVKVADRFIATGLIVRTVGKAGKEMDRQMAHSRGTWLGFPMVVLVDGATASAAEILAGALQDHERAVVLGNPTFGKGSVQTVMTIDGCGAKPCGLKLTVSRYYTPSGRSIQGQGITPNIIVDAIAPPADSSDGEAVRERSFDRHLKNEQGDKHVEVKRLSDHQLQVALDYLKSWAVFSKQSVRKG